MDAARFDAWTRRRFGIATGTALLGLLGLGLADSAGAKKGKLKRNRFGCVAVGDACRGRDKVCCSGICRGKRPKKGEKDKSRCAGHDAGGCRAGPLSPFCGGETVPCTTSTGDEGSCATTTGNAGYCTNSFSLNPTPCKRDADCKVALGAKAACVVCPDVGGTRCLGVADI